MKIPDLSYEIILNENQIKERVVELGRQITLDYGERDLVLIAVLKGSLLFFADLIRSIYLPILTDIISVSSYNGSMNSSGDVKIVSDISIPVKDKDILIVEDIIDTGATSKFLFNHFKNLKPRSFGICTLLNKQQARIPSYDININYIGFDVPDKFLIGYGLDYQEKYRNLPYIAAVKKQAEGV